MLRVLLAAVLLSQSACSMQRYEAAPLAARENAQRIAARQASSGDVRAFMLANGLPAQSWPLAQWGLRELTLLAFYYHPDLDVARAFWASAQAGELSTREVPRIALSVDTEHHSRREDGRSPWTLGVAFDLAFVGTSKRQALIERAEKLSQAARAEVGTAAWNVYARLRTRLLDYAIARQETELLTRERDLRREIVQLYEQRAKAGMLAPNDLLLARMTASENALRLAQAASRSEVAYVAIAEALGILSKNLRLLKLDERGVTALPRRDALPDLQRDLLWNRMDIEQALRQYEAADAALKLELARQYPDFSIEPGFSWDQGDRRWLLGFNVGLPLPRNNLGAIAEARAQRVLQAQRFSALQASLIAQLEQAEARYMGSLRELDTSEQAQRLSEERVRRTEKQFSAGYADRLALTHARLEQHVLRYAQWQARSYALRALGQLEDVVQRPLNAAPLPAVPYQAPRAALAAAKRP